MMMLTTGSDSEAAFACLRRYSQNTSKKAKSAGPRPRQVKAHT